MSAVVIVGTQWGDEGKGKVTDYLAQKADVVVRYQGGPNAGHTVVLNGHEFRLHLLPSGVLYPEKTCVIGNGVVVDPRILIDELESLEQRGISTSNVNLSERAHLIFPYHVKLDELEEQRRGANKIGTTLKGVGPAYMDKAARIGIRVVDLMEEDVFVEKLKEVLKIKNDILQKVYDAPPFSFQEIAEAYLKYAVKLQPYVKDVSKVINKALDANQHVLFEGAQGTFLDMDFGTYPYVTSSHPVAGAACIGSGVGPTRIDKVVGVVKAYTSRVGDGPFPTELRNEIGDLIRTRGHEYGTTTGRPRRCGWLDAVMLRFAIRVSGISSIAITRLDVLQGISPIKICIAYKYQGRIIEDYPASLSIMGKCEPVYIELDGWNKDIEGIQRFDDLPAEAINYVRKVQELVGVPVSLLSTGRDRNQTIELSPVF